MQSQRPVLGEIADLEITSLGGLGDGIGTHQGKPVFVPKSLPGDRLNVRIVHENRDGLQGQIRRIITPSPNRHIPPCRYFESCGGCGLQQLSPDYYRTFKTDILKHAASHAGITDIIPEMHFVAAASRRRVEFKIDSNHPACRLAFHAPRSHTPVVIDNCLILEPKLQALIAPLNDALAQWPFARELFAISLTAADSGTDMLLTFRNPPPPLHGLEPWLEKLGIERISARSKEGKPKQICAVNTPTMHVGQYPVPLPADAFLQATREGQRRLTEAALAVCDKGTRVADLFCGIGTYSRLQ